MSFAPTPSRIAWRGWNATDAPEVSIARLTKSSNPASTPSATESDAPSSASIVFSATIGSLSGRASVPNAASSAKRVNRSAAGNADSSARKRPSTKTMRGASIRGRRASKVLSSPTRLIGSWNAASATGRRLVYFHASSRRPELPPGSPAWRNASAAASRNRGSPGRRARSPSKRARKPGGASLQAGTRHAASATIPA